MIEQTKCCNCGNELVNSIDVYGEDRAPLCRSCWLSGIDPRAKQDAGRRDNRQMAAFEEVDNG